MSVKIYTACHCVLLISQRRFPRIRFIGNAAGIEEKYVCVIESGQAHVVVSRRYFATAIRSRRRRGGLASFSHARNRSFLPHLTLRFSHPSADFPPPFPAARRRPAFPIRRSVLLVFSIHELCLHFLLLVPRFANDLPFRSVRFR